MNIESINQDYEKMIREEVDSNPALYHLYREFQSAGLNVDWNGAPLAKAFCLMLVRHNKNLKDQLLKAHTNSVRPLFITTPESKEDLFKRGLDELSDPAWKVQSTLAAERMKIYQSLAIDPDKLSQDIISAAHEMRMKRQQYSLGFPTSFRRGMVAGRNLKYDQLYLAKTTDSLECPLDLLHLLISAKENAKLDDPLMLEVSEKSYEQIKDLLERESVFKSDDPECSRKIMNMRITKMPKIDDYFIGVLYDFGI